TIGTVNSVEFILTTAISITFLIHLGWEVLTVSTVGLLVGGVVAAPIGAMLTKHINAKLLLRAVGIVLIATSLFGVAKALGFIG
ncbi:MAG: sulfite exporter TauE/SafE family protein, partial [Sphingobium sp.]